MISYHASEDCICVISCLLLQDTLCKRWIFRGGQIFHYQSSFVTSAPDKHCKSSLSRNSFFGGWCNMGIVDCEITGCMTLHPCNAAYPAIMQYVGWCIAALCPALCHCTASLTLALYPCNAAYPASMQYVWWCIAALYPALCHCIASIPATIGS